MSIDKAKFDAKIQELKQAYYNGHPLISDIEYDKLIAMYKDMYGVDESVGAPVKINEIKKVKHKFPAKSLDKTKDIDKFIDTFNISGDMSDDVVLMWKLDGSTVQLTYYQGKLVNAATRGDGIIGQDITHNSKYISGIPQTVTDGGIITVRGEAIMSYPSFKEINNGLSDEDKYENPRNLANASIAMKDPKDMMNRGVEFKAFELVSHPNLSKMSFNDRLMWTYNNGFGTVDFVKIHLHQLKDYMKIWEETVPTYDYPVDGLVVAHDNAPYSDTLKGTEHHPHQLHGYAFKWADEEKETVVKEIIWQPSRTGLLNPVAVFEPVRLEGTTVERASLHNFSIMRNLHIRVGDKVTVYKANKIIPQIASTSDTRPYSVEDVDNLVDKCPKCGQKAHIHRSSSNIETVYCDNPSCGAKLLDRLVHFCSRNAMDISGLSEATLQKFIDRGFINSFNDIYKLDRYEYEIRSMDGFGDKSWTKIWNSIQKSRNTDFVKFITALGIPGISSGQAKLLSRHFDGKIGLLINENNLKYDFTVIDGFGEVLSNNIQKWLESNIGIEMLELINNMNFNTDELGTNTLSGKTFVVTGKVYKFVNRDEIHKFIEDNGGKVSGSVSSKTSYLVNNDIESTSGKNKKAKELNVPIISEEQLIELVNC